MQSNTCSKSPIKTLDFPVGIYLFRGRCSCVFVANFRQVFTSRIDVLYIELNVLKVQNKETEARSESCQTSEMKLFPKMVEG